MRLREIEGSENLYIRSMASRGHPGGLANSARALVKIMETMGYDVVLMETVGAGQDQTNVALIVDTTIVVVASGLGDRLQAIKSGILEVGDIFVVNKGDRLGADGTAADLLNAVMMGERKGWHPPVIKTVALESEGHRGADGGNSETCRVQRGRGKREGPETSRGGKRDSRGYQNAAVRALLQRRRSDRQVDERVRRPAMRKKERPLILADAILREKGIS